MLSRRLIHMIQNHADALMNELIRTLKTHPSTPSYHRLSDAEILTRSYVVYKNLGEWMEGQPEEKIRQHYEELGRIRFEENIPLHEVIYALTLTKNHLLEYIRTHGLAGNVLELYAEKELLLQFGYFFDNAIYHTAVGYDNARSESKPAKTKPAKRLVTPAEVGATPSELSRL